MSGANIDTSSQFQNTFTNYLNSYFSFNLTYNDYINFLSECSGVSADSALQTFKNIYDTAVPQIPSGTILPMMMMSFSMGGGFSPMGLSPGEGIMDPCACNTIFKLYEDSVNHRRFGTLASMFSDSFPSHTFADIDAKLKKCQYFLEKDGKKHKLDPPYHWSTKPGSSVYAMNHDAGEQQIGVPLIIKCPDAPPITSGPGDTTKSPPNCDSLRWTCVGLNDYMDSFETRHPGWFYQSPFAGGPDSLTIFADSLNARFNRGGCHLIPYSKFNHLARTCKASNPQCFPDPPPTCNLIPNPNLKALGELLEAFAFDTTFINDSLKLNPRYATYLGFIGSACITNLYKIITNIDQTS